MSYGDVFPGGSLHNVSYNDLRAMGSGEHYVAIDPAVPSKDTSSQYIATSDDRLFHKAKFAIFGYDINKEYGAMRFKVFIWFKLSDIWFYRQSFYSLLCVK